MRLISRVPSRGDENVTMSPRCGSPSGATTMSVSGTLTLYASRLTNTTSPSSSVGRIEPDGIGFQSATAVRNTPKHSRNTMKPLFLASQLFIVFSGSVSGWKMDLDRAKQFPAGAARAAETSSMPRRRAAARFAGNGNMR